MNDLIRRDDVLKALLGWETDPTDEEIEYTIKSIPTAKTKVGKWERKPYKRQGHEEVVIEGYSWRCSNCGDARKRNEPDMNYCPNCGAKMERSE